MSGWSLGAFLLLRIKRVGGSASMFFKIVRCNILPNDAFFDHVIIKTGGSDTRTYLNLRLRSLLSWGRLFRHHSWISILFRNVLYMLKLSQVFQIFNIHSWCTAFLDWFVQQSYIKNGKLFVQNLRMQELTGFPLRFTATKHSMRGMLLYVLICGFYFFHLTVDFLLNVFLILLLLWP